MLRVTILDMSCLFAALDSGVLGLQGWQVAFIPLQRGILHLL
jgi:hypothetical protein